MCKTGNRWQKLKLLLLSWELAHAQRITFIVTGTTCFVLWDFDIFGLQVVKRIKVNTDKQLNSFQTCQVIFSKFRNVFYAHSVFITIYFHPTVLLHVWIQLSLKPSEFWLSMTNNLPNSIMIGFKMCPFYTGALNNKGPGIYTHRPYPIHQPNCDW